MPINLAIQPFASCALLTLAIVMQTVPAQAQYTDGIIKIGVMNDMSGTYKDLSGQGSVVAARMAVEDFGAAAKGMKVEIVGADHQNKPDVGSNVVRTWIDTDKVDAVVDVPTSSVALAVNEIVRDKNKVFLVSGAEKAKIVKTALVDGALVPATMARPDHGRLRFILDRPAAVLLQGRS